MAAIATEKSAVASSIPWFQNEKVVLGLTGLVTLFYFLYAQKTQGFYQQDEAGHFLSMLNFWYDPKLIMGNWAKPGYKIMYVLTALGGKNAVAFQNCLFAAFSGFFAFKAAKALKAEVPILAFILLVTQPLWISLSFRNYSEIPTAFLLSVALWAHFADRKWLAAIMVSLVVTIRQEFYPFLGLYGLYLLFTKNWLSAFALALFPLVQNLMGWHFFGDPLYLLHQITGQSEGLKDAYPRQGFDHYFLTSAVVFGPLALTLFIGYLGACALNRKLPELIIIVPLFGFFLLNCLFNWQGHPIGPSTGGNLRYMCVIAPLVSVAAALVFDAFKLLDNKFRLLVFLVPFFLVVAIMMGYKHNFVSLTDESDPVPALGTVLAIVLIFLPVAASVKVWYGLLVGLLLVLTGVKSVKLSNEDKVCKSLAQWYKTEENSFKGKTLFINHVMFYYYLGKTDKAMNPSPILLTQEALEKAPAGSVIFWDSHYSYRPTMKRGVPIEYFQQHINDYNLLNEFRAEDDSFVIFAFEKK